MTGLPDGFCAEAGHLRYPIGIDVGDVAPGHRLIVRGICLFDDQLTLHYAWVPGLTVDYGDGDIYPNFRYDADDGTETGAHAPC